MSRRSRRLGTGRPWDLGIQWQDLLQDDLIRIFPYPFIILLYGTFHML